MALEIHLPSSLVTVWVPGRNYTGFQEGKVGELIQGSSHTMTFLMKVSTRNGKSPWKLGRSRFPSECFSRYKRYWEGGVCEKYKSAVSAVLHPSTLHPWCALRPPLSFHTINSREKDWMGKRGSSKINFHLFKTAPRIPPESGSNQGKTSKSR
jgi:hypothetical protein